MPVRNAIAFEVPNGSHLDARKAGAFYFMHNRAGERMGITHACPCGCGGKGAMWFTGMADAGGQEWDVKGEWPKVTLSPSIGFGRLKTGGYHWHGFLENGVFVER